MKKSLLSILCGIIIIATLSGCENASKSDDKKTEISKIICTMSNKDEYSEEIDTGVIEYKDNKVISLEQKSVFKMNNSDVTEEEIDTMLKELDDVGSIYDGINGYTFETKKINSKEISLSLIIDYSKIDLEQIKDILGEDYLEENFPNGKETTVDDVKEMKFQDYECQ